MNETEHLLTVLAEEGCEVAERACKANRFGLSEVQPGQSDDNKRRIERELADLVATAELLGFKIRDEDKMVKHEKLTIFMALSYKLGTIQKEGTQWAICSWCAGTGKEERTFSICPKCGGVGGMVTTKPPEQPITLCQVQDGCFGQCGKLLPCPDHPAKPPVTVARGGDLFLKFLEENCPGDDAHGGGADTHKPLLERCSMCRSLYEAHRRGRAASDEENVLLRGVIKDLREFIGETFYANVPSDQKPLPNSWYKDTSKTYGAVLSEITDRIPLPGAKAACSSTYRKGEFKCEKDALHLDRHGDVPHQGGGQTWLTV